MVEDRNRRTLSEQLARRVHPEPSPAFIEGLAGDDELMAMANDDMEKAEQALIQYAIDTVTAYVAVTTELKDEQQQS